MKEDEYIASYLRLVEEIISTIKGLGVELDDSVVVQKVFIYFPMIFDPKISSLEERVAIGMIIMDKLH